MCACVRMCACVVGMHVCMCVYMFIHLCVHLRLCVRTLCMCAHIPRTCPYLHMFVCACIP